MRLERIFTHRVIRLLRAVIPVLVIVLVAIPAWNYYARKALRTRTNSPRLGTKLPSNVSVRTEGFKYRGVEGGRTEFVVNAKQSLGYKDDKYILQDVDVTVYGKTGLEPPRTVHGKNCTYDQKTNDFTCTGDIRVQLDERTTVLTENLIYNHQAGIVTAPERATIDQQGTQAHANSFEYDMNSGLLKLNGDVRIETTDHVQVQTAAALFQQKQNWATMSGGVSIQSPNGWIRGSTGRADLQPGTYKPKLVTIDGDVTAESQGQSRPDQWKVRAAWMEATFSPAGTIGQVRIRGNAEIEKMAGDVHQRIAGEEIDTKFRDGAVDTLEARQNARMVMGSDQTLESTQIWTNARGVVQTADASVLKVGDSTILGKEFAINNTDDIVTFSTLRPATLKKSDGQESSSDQTRARFDSKTSMLIELVQSGHFQFRTTQYQGQADIGRFEQGGTVITLQGSPIVSDAEKRLEASQIRVNQSNNSFVATKNVSTLMKNASEPVLVKAGHAEGGADSILYTDNVQLWRGEAYIKAERLNASRSQGGLTGQQGKLHAEGAGSSKVQSNLKNIRATSDILDYDDSRSVVHYAGHVRAQKQDMILEAPDMTVNFRDKNVTEIVASGGVAVTRVDQRGTGDKAVYDAATDVVTLTGKPAEVRDKERGLTRGAKLTIKDKAQSVSVEGGNGQPTVTKHPVKNDKK